MPTTMPDRARLTYTEAVNWIAFRQPTQRDQTGAAQAFTRWGEHFSVHNEPGVLLALRALNGGPPLWTPPNPEADVPVEFRKRMSTMPVELARYQEAAQHIIQESGESAQRLIADLEAEYQDFREKKSAFDRAKQQLSDALVTGDLAWAPVPPRIGAYAAVEGVDGWDSWLFKQDVLRLWPDEPPQMPSLGTGASPRVISATSRRGASKLTESSGKMLAALEELRTQGVAFKSLKDAHRAVMTHLGVTNEPPGYHYKTFYRIARDILKRR